MNNGILRGAVILLFEKQNAAELFSRIDIISNVEVSYHGLEQRGTV